MTIVVQKPGLLTTLQDAGRFGYQKYGVIASGAMDAFAHTTANLLVGNEQSEASLEMTVIGPTLYFEASVVIAVCGSPMSPTVDGIPVPMWRPIYMRPGSSLQFGAASQGSRCYLAVAGGFDVPRQMNSYATYLRAGIGGFEGRALDVEDRLQFKPASVLGAKIAAHLENKGIGSESPFIAAAWRVSNTIMPDYRPDPVVRVIPGAQYDLFEPESLYELTNSSFRVQPKSDRMGYRLEGKPLQMLVNKEMLSEPVTFGTVQVPPDGQPIVLMADRQTTGGYPKIAQVITVDLPLMAQAQIGSKIRFQLTDLRDAQELHLLAQYNVQLLKASIDMKIR
ncbi:5-oxoprolinase subunit C family protein [Paenibacillus eucommiae]|uniref:Antagonist of KipI n=1 Tax=Paenibacillus eucommiae TaxID=1355755 RepID=A0ABS4IQB2_9BACL|nr:biotin-dependent carboxyltransferase family protein [Paenibacillus eucommiae]MBP1988799.1 antagonist of KipI [Paenibacillus eucommiae]